MKTIKLDKDQCAIIISEKEVSFMAGEDFDGSMVPTHIIYAYTIFYLLSSCCDKFQNFLFNKAVEAFKSVGLDIELKLNNTLH